MMTTKFITNVRIIDNRERATTNVLLDLRGEQHVLFRTPKMMLRDLQQSGRALTIPAQAFDNGYMTANPMFRAKFMAECHKLRGAELIGDITAVKAGDAWVGRDGVSQGVRLKDGLAVEGFLTIPLTETEMYRMERAEASASMEQMTAASMDLLAMYGIAAKADDDDDDEREEYQEDDKEDFKDPNDEPEEEEGDMNDEISEAFGTAPTATAKPTAKPKATK